MVKLGGFLHFSQREQINRAREHAWKATLNVGLSPDVRLLLCPCVFVLSYERFGAKLRVTENRCVVFAFSTLMYA